MKVMEKGENKQCNHPQLVAVLIFCIILILTLMCSVCYGAVYVTRQFERQNLIISNLQKRLTALENIHRLHDKTSSMSNMKREKREVISSPKIDLSSLLRGPAGPPDPQGWDGGDGKDGKDFSFDLLKEIVKESVNKEWAALSTSLPAYGGATYIRWGKKSCPSDSKIIYGGQMTGASWLSVGGGPNWQCLPDDPEYSQKPPNALFSSLRATHYRGKLLHNHRIPCVACETEKRLTQIMIPAKVKCPSSDWSLDYRGYLYSTAETENHSEDFQKAAFYRGNYVCVDESPESLTSQAYSGQSGGVVHLVKAQCGGSAKLDNCPPYQDIKALSCVVCSK